MTQRQIIDHWKKGAKDSLDVARLCLEAGKYEHALFQCHLAVEKSLKAVYMEQHGEDHPHTHDLRNLASLIQHSIDSKDVECLQELTEFVTDARYSDPHWAMEEATQEKSQFWIGMTERILSTLLHQ